MEKVTINKINRTERVSARTKKPYTSLGLLVNEYGSEWLSGFGSKDNALWKEGDTVEIIITEVVKDGKTYKNFETPKKEAQASMDTEKILNAIAGLRLELREFMTRALPKEDSYPRMDETNDVSSL